MDKGRLKEIISIVITVLLLSCIIMFAFSPQNVFSQDKKHTKENPENFAFANSEEALLEGCQKNAFPAVRVYGTPLKYGRFRVAIQSESMAVRDYYTACGLCVCEVAVDSCEIGLKQASGKGNIHIAGIEITKPESETVYFKDLFAETDESVLSEKEIEKIFGQSRGRVSGKEGLRDTSLVLSVNPGSTADFDKYLLPIIFQLTAAAGADREIGTYEFYGRIRYKVTVRTPQKSLHTFFVNTDQAVCAVAQEHL